MRRGTQLAIAIGVVVAIGGLYVASRPGATPTPTPVATSTETANASAFEEKPPPRRYDIHHVLGTGQSLSVGTVGIPPLTRAQPFHNLMFDGGVMPESELGGLVPLVEGDLIPGSMMRVETMSSGFANLVTSLSHGEHAVLVSLHGIGGEGYDALKKGGTRGAYENGLAQARAAKEDAVRLGKSYVITAVTNVHGETDHMIGNAHYADDLAQWQSDYDADLRAISGQTEPIPMFETQISSWTRYGSRTSSIAAQQLAAHVAAAATGKVVLVGAKYHLPYASDGIHLSSDGYRHMGEDYAKAYRRVVLEHGTWEPVRPKSIARAGRTITIVFHVPAPPLVFDTKLVSDPGSRGFEYADDASPPSIASVALAGPDAVTITLSAEPTGQNRRIRYAWTGTPGAPAGPQTGPRGNLRDSDATPSLHGYPLFNWCVHFDEPVP